MMKKASYISKKNYDYILIDCDTIISFLTLNGIKTAADSCHAFIYNVEYLH